MSTLALQRYSLLPSHSLQSIARNHVTTCSVPHTRSILSGITCSTARTSRSDQPRCSRWLSRNCSQRYTWITVPEVQAVPQSRWRLRALSCRRCERQHWVTTLALPIGNIQLTSSPSGGLNPSGGPSDGCSSSTGQVYARGGTYNGRFAIMYAWYMPKDSPSSGLGHRHDWESAVVWLSAQTTTASIVGGAASAHGDFDTTTTPNLSGNSLLIRYYSVWPVNHQYVFDGCGAYSCASGC